MSQDSTNPAAEALSNFTWLLDNWAAGMGAAIEGMGSPAPVVEVAPERAAAAEGEPGEAEAEAGAGAPDPTIQWWAQAFNLHSSHCVWIGMAEPVRRQIGRDALVAAGIEEPADGDIESTFHELVTQSMSGLAAKMAARCGREVTSHPGSLVTEIQGEVTRRAVVFRTGDAAFEVTFAASHEFLELLMRAGFYRQSGWIARDQRSGDRRGRGARATDRAPEPAPARPSPARDSLPFDSVLDMDIPVSMSFGSAKLRLDEMLHLRNGSVMVLGCAIDELVDLQVNGRVVARGEVVVVRGQYGLRIRELASETERMAQIDPSLLNGNQRPEIEEPLNAH